MPDAPTTEDICAAHIFDDPLMPVGQPTTTDNQALLEALQSFAKRTARDDFTSLTTFVDGYPMNPWRMAVATQLGREFYHTGRYSRAIATWKKVWDSGQTSSDEVTTALVNRSASQLAKMYARLGRMAELRPLLAALERRSSRGMIGREIRGATQGLWSMEHQPGVSFRCGPLALDRICFATERKAGNPLIENAESATNGFSARQVAELSRAIGLNYQVAFRTPGSQVILPAVAHWKVGHYAALIARDRELIRVEDPTFGKYKIWLSDAALDEEASGYFLVRSGRLPPGWRRVSESEAGTVYGQGTTDQSDEDSTTENDEQTCPSGSNGMAQWNVHLLLASHHVEDTPVGYTPPVGPTVYTKVSYDAVNGWPDYGLPYSNVSQEWRLNWLAYITDDPMNPAGDIAFAANGGGTLWFSDFNETNQVFSNLFRNTASLTRTGTNSYEIKYPDGSKKIFDKPDGSVGTLRKVFMSAMVDPAGNAVTLQFDLPGRIVSITDGIGQKTQFFYDFPITNVVPTLRWVPPYVLTRVVDPFGRTCSFDYGGFAINARLYGITDAIGLTSTFLYEYIPGKPDHGMTNLTTAYGTTSFSRGYYSGIYRANWVEITHPNGEKERVEYSEKTPAQIFSTEPLAIVPKGVPVRNYILWARNTYHWDRQAYAQGYSPNDYTKARIYHWTHEADYTTASPILESYKAPLEHRMWFNYDGQPNATFAGTSDRPTKVARTLEDGTTQLYQFEYNPAGNTTKAVDPIGRELTLNYDTNDIDVTEIRQTRAGQNESLLSVTYNAQHLPLTIIDAARQTTSFSYNTRGQALSVTDPLGHTTTLSYDANGYLVAVDGPLPGTNDTSLFAYDAVGRVRSATDQNGYTLVFDYDDLDRVTKVTFPDNTYYQIVYNRLDPETIRDRTGRETKLTYNSLREVVAVQDALNRITRYQWCGCGGLASVTDPLGRMTSWSRDFQGRVTTKIYADGSVVKYEYDTATGWLKSIRDEQNQVTRFDYNLDGTLRQKRYFDALIPTASVKLTYDPNYTRVTSVEDGSGLTTFVYNPITGLPNPGAGELVSIDGPLPNDTTTFEYDALGRVSKRSLNGYSVARSWDAAGRLQQMTNLLGVFAITWDGDSFRPATVNYPNGQRSTYSYYSSTKDQFLNQVSHFKADSTLLSRFTYDYNGNRRISDWTQERAGQSPIAYHFDYDASDRLTNAVGVVNGATIFSGSYRHDDAHNLSNVADNGVNQALAYTALNEPDWLANDSHASRTYEWNAERRLVAFNQGAHRTEFSYDAFGRRTRIVEKENGAITSEHRYVWCGPDLCEERDATGTNVLKRFHALGLQAGAGADVPAGNYFYTRDHLSSVRELTDSSGQARAVYDYSPFGKRTRLSGDLNSDFGFTGFYLHSASELNLALHRAYDANLGRWLNRDPLGLPHVNLYAYASGDPINMTDPLGLDESRPDLLHVDTGNDFINKVLGKVKSVWDKTPWAKKTTKPAEEFYDKVETGIEIYNDVEKVRKLAGNCPNEQSWDQLKNSGKEGAEIFKTFNKWVSKLTSKIPGSKAVTGPSTELADQILDTGVEAIEDSHGLFGGNSESGRQAQRILAGHDD